MAIDIDAFLQRHKDDPVSGDNEGQQQKKSQQPSLEFEKQVEENLSKVASSGEQSKDLDTLQSIYDEIKRFEEDLPGKFLNIDQSGVKALQEIGDRYSENVLKQNEQFMQDIDKKISSYIEDGKTQLQNQEYLETLKDLVRAKRLYHSIPLSFTSQKTKHGEAIFSLQSEVYEQLERHKDELTNIIKNHLKSYIIAVNNALKNEQVEEIEQRIQETQSFIDHLPLYFHGMLTKEMSICAHILAKAESQLRETAEQLFKEREDEIHKLYEHCKKAVYQRDVNSALSLYDQMVAAFEALPDYDLTRKTQIYEQLIETYSSLNNVMISENVSMFLKAYHGSKVVEEVASYLRKVGRTKKVDPDNLTMLKEKLQAVPDSTSRKEELLAQIERIEHHISTRFNSQKTTENTEDTSSTEKETTNNTQNSQNQPQKPKQPSLPRTLITEDASGDALTERINSMYQSLCNSKDPEERQDLTERLYYFIRFLSMPEEQLEKLRNLVAKAASMTGDTS